MIIRGFVFLAVALAAQSATIVSVSGPVNFSGSVGSNQAQTAGFTTSQTYTNLTISAFLSGPAAQTYNAYLTTAIGPGTTVASQVATLSQNFPGFSPASVTPIFTGLTLAPNTYYLTIFNPATTNGAWSSTNAPVVVTAPGAANTFSGYFITNDQPLLYPPAAGFANLNSQAQTLLYTVATLEIPEPSTLCLVISALLLCLVIRRRSAKHNRPLLTVSPGPSLHIQAIARALSPPEAIL